MRIEIRSLSQTTLANGVVVPAKFDAIEEVAKVVVRLQIEVNRFGDAVCTRLEVEPQTRGGRVMRSDLQQLPVSRLVTNAAVLAASSPMAGRPEKVPGKPGITKVVPLTADEAEQTTELLHRREPRRGLPITDEHLDEVAKVYRDALGAGARPTKAVMAAFHAKRPTASKWVRAARDRGFLGPAIPGKAGEAR